MKTIAFELEVNIFKRNEAFIKTAKCNGFANNALVYMHLHMYKIVGCRCLKSNQYDIVVFGLCRTSKYSIDVANVWTKQENFLFDLASTRERGKTLRINFPFGSVFL